MKDTLGKENMEDNPDEDKRNLERGFHGFRTYLK
jgi:hypothetical protein